jgi:hypothetical protein
MIIKPCALLLAVLLTPATAVAQSANLLQPSAQERSARAALVPKPPPPGCAPVGNPVTARPLTAPAPSALLPVQLEIRTPVEPTAFPSGGRTYLIHELHLRNFAGEALELQGLEVMDAGTGQPLATFGATQLDSLLSPRGHDLSAGDPGHGRTLMDAQGAIAYLCLAFEPGVAVPETLRHRVLLKDAHADGPAIGTRQVQMRTLAPPVAGADWIAAGGPGNTSHHRVGLLVIGGNTRISRRYAIDWRQVRDGTTFDGDPARVGSYHAYGKPVLAVADATVVAAKDGQPDNIPRTAKGFETALPVTMETIAGNAVTLDLGGGQFALYAHLEPGSVLVKNGDRVRRGQPLGRIGNSGDSREPHLHFEVSDSPALLAGEGLPYLIDRFAIRTQDGDLDERANELPLLEMAVDFDGPARER